jgi:hypothetical protein
MSTEEKIEALAEKEALADLGGWRKEDRSTARQGEMDRPGTDPLSLG